MKNIYQTADAVFNDAVDRAAVKIYLRKQEKGCKMFMFCGCAPKVGTTTVSINVAVAMAESGWNTVLIDSDIRKESSFKRLHSGEENIASFITGKVDGMESIIQPTNHDNLYYISAGFTEKNPVRLLCSAQMREIIEFAKEKFDFVIIDVPAFAAAIDACILAPMVDDVIMIVAWNSTTKDQIVRTKSEIEASGGRVSGVIINRMDGKTYTRNNRNAMYFPEKRYAKGATRGFSRWSRTPASKPMSTISKGND